MLFNIIPVFKVRYKRNSAKYYLFGIPLLKIVQTGMYSKDIYFIGGFLKVIKSHVV